MDIIFIKNILLLKKFVQNSFKLIEQSGILDQ